MISTEYVWSFSSEHWDWGKIIFINRWKGWSSYLQVEIACRREALLFVCSTHWACRRACITVYLLCQKGERPCLNVSLSFSSALAWFWRLASTREGRKGPHVDQSEGRVADVWPEGAVAHRAGATRESHVTWPRLGKRHLLWKREKDKAAVFGRASFAFLYLINMNCF